MVESIESSETSKLSSSDTSKTNFNSYSGKASSAGDWSKASEPRFQFILTDEAFRKEDQNDPVNQNSSVGRLLTAPDADSGIEDEDQTISASKPTCSTGPVPPDNLLLSPGSPSRVAPHSVSNNQITDPRTPENFESYAMEGVNQHNFFRKSHNAPPLMHSHELQKMAQSYADYLSEARIGEETQNSPNFENYGENILFVPYVCFMSAKQATSLWYRQIRNIDLADITEEKFNAISSFSQIVWKNTEAVGIGISFGKRGGCYVVANYFPKMELTFANFFFNVSPPRNPFSVREDQYEIWSALSATQESNTDALSRISTDPSSASGRPLLSSWDRAVAVENAKNKLLKTAQGTGSVSPR